VKRKWKRWEIKAVIAQNEEQSEILLDEMRKTTNDHRIIDVGRYWNRTSHYIYYECYGFANCLDTSHVLVFREEKNQIQKF
jgi:hypothetical protein